MYSVREDELGTGIGIILALPYHSGHIYRQVSVNFQRQTKGLKTINNNLKVFLKFHNE